MTRRAKKVGSKKTPESVSLAAIPRDSLVAAFAKATGASTASTLQRIEADIAAGAPTNADGSIHLVHYLAWLVSEAR